MSRLLTHLLTGPSGWTVFSRLRTVVFKMNLFRPCKRLARTLHSLPSKRLLVAQHSTVAREFKVTLDGQTLYVEKELAQALGWAPGISTDVVSLRLSGWDPHYFAITQTGTDAGMLSNYVTLVQTLTFECW